jgi:hypothetical protein
MPKENYTEDDRAIQDAEFAKRHDATTSGKATPQQKKEYNKLTDIIQQRPTGWYELKQLKREVEQDQIKRNKGEF